MIKNRFRPLRGPTLVVQIVILLLGGLVVAQIVTLLLTLLLPPAPTPQYHLDAVASALRGERVAGNLQRIVQAGPPDLGGRGWLVSERSRKDLAGLLHTPVGDVRLSFYTPLPFAGTVAARRMAMADDGPVAPRESWLRLSASGPVPSAGRHAGLILAQMTVPSSPPAGPGPVLPNGVRLPPDGRGPNRDMLPPPPGTMAPPQGRQRSPNGALSPARPGAPTAGPLIELDPTPVQGRDGIWIGGDHGETIPPILGGPPSREPVTGTGQGPATGAGGLTGNPDGYLASPLQGIGPNAPGGARFGLPMPNIQQPLEGIIRSPSPPLSRSDRETAIEMQRQALAQPRPVYPSPAPLPPSREVLPVIPQIELPSRFGPSAGDEAPAADGEEAPLPLLPRERGLFGLAPAPFVEGDFVAALRLRDGRWAVVQPAAEPFPNSWQRRVLLWFLIAFAIVAPAGWLFARRMSKPLVAFTEAAERLGRDPTAPVLDLDGPAEVGRAAHAFNVMQSRVKSFVGDRTAMIGAISHDLRTPLTRLRFRIEEVDDDKVREGMIEEVEEMEEMINSVLAFLRDASSPGVRERIDLRTIVEDVAEDAAIVGNEVRLDEMAPVAVDVDVMGMRRLFANLLENAAKYGERAHVSLRVDQGQAVAEVFDEGPGVPDEDLERAFEPFYRAANARSSEKRGSGLGLAVCRSIARAHGGDVALKRSPRGFAAEVRLPLAFEPAE
jgi:signal transduction histidine kinase